MRQLAATFRSFVVVTNHPNTGGSNMAPMVILHDCEVDGWCQYVHPQDCDASIIPNPEDDIDSSCPCCDLPLDDQGVCGRFCGISPESILRGWKYCEQPQSYMTIRRWAAMFADYSRIR
jgi:hypothetical protein